MRYMTGFVSAIAWLTMMFIFVWIFDDEILNIPNSMVYCLTAAWCAGCISEGRGKDA